MVNSLNFHDESWYKACNCLKKIWFQIHQTKGVHKTDTGEITSLKKLYQPLSINRVPND